MDLPADCSLKYEKNGCHQRTECATTMKQWKTCMFNWKKDKIREAIRKVEVLITEPLIHPILDINAYLRGWGSTKQDD